MPSNVTVRQLLAVLLSLIPRSSGHDVTNYVAQAMMRRTRPKHLTRALDNVNAHGV